MTTRKTTLKKRLNELKKRSGVSIFGFGNEKSYEEVLGSPIEKMHKKVVSGEKLTRKEKDEIFGKIYGSAYFKDAVGLHGIKFDFSPALKTFWVKSKYGDIEQLKAPDKMSLRKNLYLKNTIRKIQEIK